MVRPQLFSSLIQFGWCYGSIALHCCGLGTTRRADLFAAPLWNSFDAAVAGVVSPFDFAMLMRRYVVPSVAFRPTCAVVRPLVAEDHAQNGMCVLRPPLSCRFHSPGTHNAGRALVENTMSSWLRTC
jgi:hypothetical protein